MQTTENPLSVAVVGLGRAGWDLHLKPLLGHPGFTISAVADPIPERCQEAVQLTGCRQFSSIDELLEAVPCELVVVATPSSSHYSDTTKVLNSGRHCILEKPMAMNFIEADQLRALAQERGLRLFVHHNYLHRAEYHHLQRVLASNVLGPLFHLRAFWGGYQRRWDWQTLKKNGGGKLNNTCPHILSIVLPLLGSRVKAALADLKIVKDAGDAEDHVHLVLRTDDGVEADIIASSAIALDAPRWMLCGKYGTLVCNGEKSRVRYYDPSKVPPIAVLDAAAPQWLYQKETLPWEEKESVVEPPPVKPFHENVHDVLRHQGQQVVTPESAVEVLRVLELARLSGENYSDPSAA